MKKKILSFVLALCLIIPGIALLSACNNNSPVGTYTLSSVTFGSETHTVEFYNALKEKYGQTETDEWTEDKGLFESLKELFEGTLTIYENGVFVMSRLNMTVGGTWAIDGDNLILVPTTGEDDVATATYSNNTITISTDEDDDWNASMTYVKNA